MRGRTPPAKYLKECFLAVPKNGHLYWAIRPREHFPSQAHANEWNNRKAGLRAEGRKAPNGYRKVEVDGKSHYVHRVVWALMHGDIDPLMHIDHINGDKLDNRPENLRLADGAQNAWHHAMYSHNTTGANGVYYEKKRKVYRAQIRVRNRLINLGQSPFIDVAIHLRRQGEATYYGEYANHSTNEQSN